MKRILACLDASPRASLVVERAASLARATGAKVVLCRVVGLPQNSHIPPEALSMSPDALVELWRRNAERDLEAVRANEPAYIIDSIVVKVGAPWFTICAIARELAVDVIVLGSHGYQGVDRLLGTTAAKVVNHADQSVFVVR